MPLPPINRERLARRRAKEFGPRAAWCREQPCYTCGEPPPSDASHFPTRAGVFGAKDKDTVPQCRGCHTILGNEGPSRLAAKTGITMMEAKARADRDWKENEDGLGY